jgi:transcriptional regulator with XRE-family HTH domain
MRTSPERQTAHQRELADRVQSYRRRHGMSQKEIAAGIGCSVATVSRLLNGEIGMAAHHENAFRNLLAVDELTARQEDLATMIAEMRLGELDATLKILQIMQDLRKLSS